MRFWNKHCIPWLHSTSKEGHRITASAGEERGNLGKGKLGQSGSWTVTQLSDPYTGKSLFSVTHFRLKHWDGQQGLRWWCGTKHNECLEQLILYPAIHKGNNCGEAQSRSSHSLFVTECPLLPRLPLFNSSSLDKKTKKNYWSVKQGQSHLFYGRICKSAKKHSAKGSGVTSENHNSAWGEAAGPWKQDEGSRLIAQPPFGHCFIPPSFRTRLLQNSSQLH